MHSVSLLTLGAALVSAQQFCDPDLSDLCFQSTTTTSDITYRIAIPPDAVEGFDTIVQIVAPVEFGWAGIAWSSSMTNGPLTIGWANGEGVVASGRVSEVYAAPEIDPNQTITVLEDASSANETHWKATVHCAGCSQWTNPAGTDVALDPAATAAPIAWAASVAAVDDPADPESGLTVHSTTGFFAVSLAEAQAEGFEDVIPA